MRAGFYAFFGTLALDLGCACFIFHAHVSRHRTLLQNLNNELFLPKDNKAVWFPVIPWSLEELRASSSQR